MEPIFTPPSRQRRSVKRSRWVPFLLAIIFSMLIGIPGVKWYVETTPNKERIDLFPDLALPIIYKDHYLTESALKDDDDLLLPITIIQQTFDPNMHWDEDSQSVIITTENRVIQFPSEQLTALINQKPFTLQVPVKKINETVYVPVAPLLEIYPISVLEAGEVVNIQHYNTPRQKGTIVPGENDKDGVYVRAGSSIKHPYYVLLQHGEVTVLGEEQQWYRIQTTENVIGYVPKKNVQLTKIETNQYELPNKSFAPWKPVGQKINLTWEYVNQYKSNTNNLPKLEGVNVVSPTWFEIIDNMGTVENKADKNYVTSAHERGYQVWALFSNGFDPDRTKEVLKNFESRQNIINQVVSYAHLYGVDGINVDFENVYIEEKDLIVQFLRELMPYLHELNLVVSVDVTIKSGSETWSLFYDRKRIAEVVDYVMVMTYDEHWATSSKAGSVASLPWTEKGLVGVLEEVPAHKLLLGVPLYTRVWEEEKQENGEIKVSSKAMGMDNVQQIIKDRNLEVMVDDTSEQHYVEYVDQGKTYKIWIEDDLSMGKRIDLVKKYNLAGVNSIWLTMKSELEKRP